MSQEKVIIGGVTLKQIGGAWIAEDTLAVNLCFYETPFRPVLIFQFGQGGVRYQFKMNVDFGPGARPALIGKLS